MIKFAAAGYVCVDYYPELNNRCYVTGNGVDVAFNLIDIRNDIETSIVSAISDDDYGKMCIEAFKKRNINCSYLEIINGSETPSVPLKLIDNDRVHGKPARGVMENFQFSNEAIDFICKNQIMHSDFTGRLIPHLERIRGNGVKVFFDLSNRVAHPDIKHVLSNIDCGLVSFGEDLENGKDFLRYAYSLGAKLMIATFGVNGSIAYDGHSFYKQDIVPVQHVVNTVGAGDSYFAGFMSALIDGKSIKECMYNGAKRAAQIISVFEPYL